MDIENVHLFSKNLTQRRKDAEDFSSSFASPRLCVIKFGLIVVLFFLPVFLSAQNEDSRFFHRLTWTEDEHARRYEVVIEKEEGEGTYIELRRESTPELFIELSLSPGKYRCQVIPYNILNQVGEESEWVYIEVLAAPDTEAVNTTHDIELVHKTGDKVNLFFSAAWMPTFAVSDSENSFLGEDRSLAGASVRFGVVWARNFFNINPGAELAVSYNAFGTGAEAEHLLTIGLNLLALKSLPGDRMALTFRLGAGYGLLFTDNGATQINAGVSYLLFVMKHLYMETGLDYVHWFTSPASYYFRPWIGIGFKK